MMEFLFKNIFIVSIKLGFWGKDQEECQSVALEWIKRGRTKCIGHKKLLFRNIFIVSIKLGFQGKDQEEC